MRSAFVRLRTTGAVRALLVAVALAIAACGFHSGPHGLGPRVVSALIAAASFEAAADTSTLVEVVPNAAAVDDDDTPCPACRLLEIWALACVSSASLLLLSSSASPSLSRSSVRALLVDAEKQWLQRRKQSPPAIPR